MRHSRILLPSHSFRRVGLTVLLGFCLVAASGIGMKQVAFAEAKKTVPETVLPEKNRLRDAPEEVHQKAQRFLDAVRAVLNEAAEARKDANKLPSERDYVIVSPPWQETREDREQRVRTLLESALDIVTDVPITQFQQRIATHRANIRELNDQIAQLNERRLTAPKDGLLPGILSDTVDSIDQKITELNKRIAENKRGVNIAKTEIQTALHQAGIDIAPTQLDLMLDSVLGGDLVKLVAAFEAVKGIDAHLSLLMDQTGESLKAARQYFAMHATLFAMLVHAQGLLIEKIDYVYLTRLDKIIGDIQSARRETRNLLRSARRSDQQRTLRANVKSQDFAEKVATYYRSYLLTQRQQLHKARKRTLQDLRIADNTFRTVEASFQLRDLIDDAKASFDALKRLEAPGFDRLFQNDKLRKEFEKLTDQLTPTS